MARDQGVCNDAYPEFWLVLGTSAAEPALPGLMRKLPFMGAERPGVGLVVPTGNSFALDGAQHRLPRHRRRDRDRSGDRRARR